MSIGQAHAVRARRFGRLGLAVCALVVSGCHAWQPATYTPPASVLLKRAANLAKGSAEPNKNKVGTVTRKQVEDIAKMKLPDLNAGSLEQAIKTVAGTARSMGITVEG